MAYSREVRMIENFQIKKMWTLAYKLNMTGDDVYALAGVEHLHELTYLEANKVVDKLLKYLEDENQVAGMISKAQIKKVWALMYQLKKLDIKESDVSIGNRLCAIIKKELGIMATEKEPFKWVDFANGKKLINSLNRYVRYAKKRRSDIEG